jgi:ankyrin repeat protein
LDIKFQTQGKIVYDNGIVNLVPLADAAQNGFLDVVQVRLLAGVNPNETTSARFSGSPAIVVAAQKGYFEVVAALAQHPQIDPKMRGKAAQEAQKHGHAKIAEYLSNFSINELNRYGNALIHEAVEKGDINQLQELLQRGADINLANRRGETPLCIAASRIIKVRSSLYADAPGSKIRANDFVRNSISIIRCLLANGANPNKYVRKSPLERAAKAGSFQAVSILLEETHKVDRIEIDPLGGPTEVTVPWYVPLMFDSYESEEWLPILGLLVSHGADLNKTNAYGNQTILSKLISKLSNIGILEEQLILSGSFGAEELIEREKKKFEVALEQLNFLLNNGADPVVSYGPKKRTALHDFTEKVDLSFLPNATEAVIERLIQAGADINEPDIDGMTPLHIAVKVKNLTAAAYLISKGADVNIKNEEGQSPLEMAEEDGLLAVLQEKVKPLKSSSAEVVQ